MCVNLIKTKILICSPGRRSMSEFWFLGEQLVDVCNSYCYLGVNIYSNGISNQSIQDISDKACVSLCKMKYKLKQLGNPPLKVSLKLFNSCIRPILLYASQVWGTRKCHAVETIMLKYLKGELGVLTSVNNNVIYHELGVLPLC